MPSYYPPQGITGMPTGGMPPQGVKKPPIAPPPPPAGTLFKLDYGRLDIDYLG